HLGLVQAGERRDLEDFIENASTLIGETVDIAALADLARPCRLDGAEPARPLPPLGQTIAVARDEAFAFTYHAVLEGWRAAGATLSFFSPLADQAPEPNACAVYLPGGYPELHAGRLAANRRFLDGTRAAAARGAAVFGECGGYMTLGRVLRDAEGAPHEMLGLLPLETSFAARRLHLGYRRARLANACPLGEAGEAFRGHEFHYATVTAEGPAEPLFHTACAAGRPLGPAGLRCGRVMGSFVHLMDLATSF
ncbi:MAG: cobyrinic acid a,c-diamide synthase, partial [Alphaproteobacteria bacterium]|nr:cobyrinic acid a,c-diamide synthase [Alphaproteobacteria bacterium]